MRAKMIDKTNRADRFSRFAPTICLLLVLILLATATAFAHDPGLSSARLKLDGKNIAARLTFARNEIAVIAPMDADGDGRITQSELDSARARLESLAKESLTVRLDGKEFSPTAVTVSLDEGDAIHFDLEFPPARGSRLVLRSLLIDKLARGHRQFLSLLDAGENTLSQR